MKVTTEDLQDAIFDLKIELGIVKKNLIREQIKQMETASYFEYREAQVKKIEKRLQYLESLTPDSEGLVEVTNVG